MKMRGQVHFLAVLSSEEEPPVLCRGRVGPIAGLDAFEKRKIACGCLQVNRVISVAHAVT